MSEKSSKPIINPELLKASAKAGKLATEAVAVESVPCLKDIMKRFHLAADEAHARQDVKGHQINNMAANKIAKLIANVYKL
jgi:hypothetical protein